VACLTLLWIASVLLALYTPIGFPFNANEASPTKQRIILHVCMLVVTFILNAIINALNTLSIERLSRAGVLKLFFMGSFG